MVYRDWAGQLIRTAVERNDLTGFKHLVQRGRSLWRIAIREAISLGRIQMVRYMVEQGVSPTIEMLHPAVEYGHVNVVSYLVGLGLRPQVSDVNMAARRGHLYIVEYFASYHWWPSQRAIDLTARHGHLEVLQYLVKHHGHHGHLPTSYAIEGAIDFGHTDVALYLIELDIFPNQMYIDLALCKGRFAVIKALAEKGRYPTDEGRVWLTRALFRRQTRPSTEALNYALEHNMVEVVKFLIGLGVQTTPFMLTVPVYNGNLELVEFLVSHGVTYHPNLLEATIRRGHLDVFKFLHRQGVPLTKWNLMMLAARGNLETAANVLQSMGLAYSKLLVNDLVMVYPDRVEHVAWTDEFPDLERPWTWEPPVDP